MGVVKTVFVAWNFVWTLLAMSLISAVIADAFAGNPSSVNYAEFTAVFCMVVVLAGIAGIFVEALAFPVAIADVLASLFSFVAGVVLAAKLHVHSCGNDAYTLHNSLTNGAHDRKRRCKELQASTAFFWFMFVGFLITAVLGFVSGGSSFSAPRRGGVRKGGPSMSQV